MKTTILGVNEINYLEYTYCETIDENLMYVQIDAQSDRKKTSQEFVLLFSKEQIVEIYKTMMKQEKTNSQFLK
jgi:hypothetical protein